MGPVNRIKVTLRVFGDEGLDTLEVGRLLGNDAADVASRSHTQPDGTVRTANSWRLQVEGEELDSLVMTIFSKVTADLQIWDELSRKYRLDLFCGLFLSEEKQGVELPPQVLRAVAERGLSIGFDIYAGNAESTPRSEN